MPPRRRSSRRRSPRRRYRASGDEGLEARLEKIQELLVHATGQMLACETDAEALASLKQAIGYQQQALNILEAARALLALQSGEAA